MKKILIIEDDQDIVDIAMIILEKEGYDVSAFTDFPGYEKVVNESNADLVLLDLNIRGYPGKEICRHIKQRDELKKMQVVLMSANPDIQAVAAEVKADAFISKPFDLTMFVDIVSENIDRRIDQKAGLAVNKDIHS